jgi:hypothetical protein
LRKGVTEIFYHPGGRNYSCAAQNQLLHGALFHDRHVARANASLMSTIIAERFQEQSELQRPGFSADRITPCYVLPGSTTSIQ